MAGFPKFKSKYDKQSIYIRIARKDKITIKLSYEDKERPGLGKIWVNKKIGWIKCVFHRPPIGNPCASGSISKDKSGKYYISLLYSVPSVDLGKVSGQPIGLDVGINSFVTTSNGDKIDLGLDFIGFRKKLMRLQRDLARKKKGSENYQKQKLRIAKLHDSFAKSRDHAQFNIVRDLLSMSPSAILVEGLKISNMSKSAKGNLEEHGKNVAQKRGLNRSILDMSWGSFYQKLESKCGERGIEFVKIPTFFASSQICSDCGYKNEDVKNKGLRKWACPCCGSVHDRDINAAINIKNKGLEIVAI